MNLLKESYLSKQLVDLKNTIFDSIEKTFKVKCKADKQISSWFFNLNYQNKIKDFFPLQYADLIFEINVYLFNKLGKYNVPEDKRVFISEKAEQTFNKIRHDLDTWNKSDDNIKITMTKDKYMTILKYNFTSVRIENYIYDNLYTRCQNDKYIIIIYLRYIKFFYHHTHLSVPPPILDFLNCDMELFGTPFNTHCKNYCSPFYDIDQYFGSTGDFFKYEFEPNKTYCANPPFTEKLMDDMAIKIVNALKNIKNISIFITIPVWDNNTRNDLELIDTMPNLEYNSFNYIKESEHLIGTRILSHEQSLFYDYGAGRYKHPVTVYLILLSNNPEHNVCKLETVYEEWKRLASIY